MERKIIEGKHEYNSEEKLIMFGYGPWVEEIDYCKWSYKEVICQAARNSFGAWCGYIEIPKEHPWFEKSYNDIEADVHGGLTFSGEIIEDAFAIGFDCAHYRDLCPYIEELNRKRKEELKDKNDESSLRIKEFFKTNEEFNAKFPDCAIFYQSYKDLSYVMGECESLADQMLAAKEN